MKMRLLCAVALLFCTALRADEVPNGPNLLRNPDFAASLDGWFLKGGDRCKSEVLVAAQEKFSRALRLDVTPLANDKAWSVVLRQSIGAPLQKGKKLTLKVWLRSPEKVQVTAFIEGAAAPYPKTLSSTLTLGTQWQEYEITSECNQDFGPGTANCGFYLSHGKGSIRLADVRLFQSDKAETPKTTSPKVEPPKAETPKVEPTKIIAPPIPGLPVAPRPDAAPPLQNFNLASLLAAEDFTGAQWDAEAVPLNQTLAGWQVRRDPQTQVEVVDVEAGAAGDFKKALRLTFTPPEDPKKYFGYGIFQPFRTPLLSNQTFVLRFWARSTTQNMLQVMSNQEEKLAPLAPGETRTRINSRGALSAYLPLTPKWTEYTVRPNPAQLKALRDNPFPSDRAHCMIVFNRPAGTIELTGFRLGLEQPPAN